MLGSFKRTMNFGRFSGVRLRCKQFINKSSFQCNGLDMEGCYIVLILQNPLLIVCCQIVKHGDNFHTLHRLADRKRSGFDFQLAEPLQSVFSIVCSNGRVLVNGDNLRTVCSSSLRITLQTNIFLGGLFQPFVTLGTAAFLRIHGEINIFRKRLVVFKALYRAVPPLK